MLHEQWLQTAAGEAAIGNADTAFSDADSGAEAGALLRREFPELLATIADDPGRVISDLDIEDHVSNNTAIVSVDGEPQLFQSPIPLKAAAPTGDEPLDLDLKRSGSEYSTESASVPLRIPDAPNNPIEIGNDLGFEISAATSEDAPAQRFGNESILFADAAGTDTDVLVASVATGAEVILQLRSAASPERVSLEMQLPEGASLRLAPDGVVEVVADDKIIGGVSAPIAVDAAGAPVASHLELDGETVSIVTSHTEPGIVHPVAVDPIVADWQTTDGNANAPTSQRTQSWFWGQKREGMAQWIFSQQFGSGCYYIPDGSHAWGLATSSVANCPYKPNTWGQWTYPAPGQTSYIPRANFGPSFFDYRSQNCNTVARAQPHGYVGLWSSEGGWWPNGSLQAYSVPAIGNPPTAWYTFQDFSPGRSVWPAPIGDVSADVAVAGLGTAANEENIPCWRDFYLGGAQIFLTDPEAPPLNQMSATLGLSMVSPTESRWVTVDSTPTATITASDPGLGIKGVGILYPEPGGAWFGNTLKQSPNSNLCVGTRGSACTNQPFTGSTSWSTAILPEGISTVSAWAWDPLFFQPNWAGEEPNHLTARDFSVRVDRTRPSVTSISGGLYTSSAGTSISIAATDTATGVDNATATALQKRSGVQRAELFVDYATQPSLTLTKACNLPGGLCPSPTTLSGSLSPGKAIGTHHYKLVVYDGANQPMVQPIEWDNSESPNGYVYRATEYDRSVSSNARLVSDQWTQLGTMNSREESATSTTTRGVVNCSGPPSAMCGEVRDVTHDLEIPATAPSDFFITTGQQVNDPLLAIPAAIARLRDESHGSVTQSGPIGDALQAGQVAPRGHASNYQRFDTLPSDGVESQVWIDPGTGLPLRQRLLADGEVESDVYWSYDTAVSTPESLPASFFLQEAPQTVGETEHYYTANRGTAPPAPDDASVGTIQDAQRFRQEFGLESSEAYVQATFLNSALADSVAEWGVPLSAAELAVMDQRVAISEAAEASIPAWVEANDVSEFAGMWIDEINGKIKVAFTANVAANVADISSEFPIANVIEGVAFSRTLSQLETLKEGISTDLPALAQDGVDVHSLSVDIMTNTVEVEASGLQDAIASNNFDPQSYGAGVIFSETPPPVQLTDYCKATPTGANPRRNCGASPLYGGLQLSNGERRCTSGFWLRTTAQRGPAAYFLATAGHCLYKTNRDWTEDLLEPVGTSSNNFQPQPNSNEKGPIDIGLIKPATRREVTRRVLIDRYHARPMNATAGPKNLVTNSPICAVTFRAAPQRCGTLEKVFDDVVAADDEGDNRIQLYDQGRLSFVMAKGSSGGAVFRRQTAIGIVSSGTPDSPAAFSYIKKLDKYALDVVGSQ